MKKIRLRGLALMLLSIMFNLNSNAQLIFSSPKMPTFNYLSTLDILTGYPTLNWSTPSLDPQYPNPTGYIIYRKEFDALNQYVIYIAIDTVESNVTSFTDNTKSFNNGRCTYAIASKGPTTPSQITNPHSNIFLTSEYDSSNNRINLKWQPYEGWGNRIKQYNVYIGNNNDWANYSLLVSLSGTITNTVVSDIIENTDYYFYVEAIKDGEPSFSTKSNLHHKFTRMLPLVLSYKPNDNATNVLPNENLVLTFSGKVKQGTSGNITIYNSNETIFESIPYNDSRISISDNVVIINPSNTFLEGASYYVKIDPNVVTNYNGDPYLGIAVNTAWNFKVSVANSTVDLINSDLTVSPNPSNGLITIRTDNLNIGDISIYDLKGVLKVKINSFMLIDIPIDLSNLTKGVYIMKIKISGDYVSKKLIIQ